MASKEPRMILQDAPRSAARPKTRYAIFAELPGANSAIARKSLPTKFARRHFQVWESDLPLGTSGTDPKPKIYRTKPLGI
jgi:hypothetical protein